MAELGNAGIPSVTRVAPREPESATQCRRDLPETKDGVALLRNTLIYPEIRSSSRPRAPHPASEEREHEAAGEHPQHVDADHE